MDLFLRYQREIWSTMRRATRRLTITTKQVAQRQRRGPDIAFGEATVSGFLGYHNKLKITREIKICMRVISQMHPVQFVKTVRRGG